MSFKYISMDITVDTRFLPVLTHFFANDYSLIVPIVMSLTSYLKPIHPTFHPFLVLLPTSVLLSAPDYAITFSLLCEVT